MTNSQEEDWSISAAAGDSSKAAAHSRATARDIVGRDATTRRRKGWPRVREEQPLGGHCESVIWRGVPSSDCDVQNLLELCRKMRHRVGGTHKHSTQRRLGTFNSPDKHPACRMRCCAHSMSRAGPAAAVRQRSEYSVCGVRSIQRTPARAVPEHRCITHCNSCVRCSVSQPHSAHRQC